MTDYDLNLNSITGLRAAMARLPNGIATVQLLTRMGLWTSRDAAAYKLAEFPKAISNLSSSELADLSARVTADAGRAIELLGALNGIDAQLKIRVRQARAHARSRLRHSWNGPKPPTKQDLDDLVDIEPTILELESHATILVLMIAAATATKDAHILYKETVSREISWRSAQMNARLY